MTKLDLKCITDFYIWLDELCPKFSRKSTSFECTDIPRNLIISSSVSLSSFENHQTVFELPLK